MYLYPVKLTSEDNATFTATFPDVPEAITFGETRAEALERAAEALEAALSIYITLKKDIPRPRASGSGSRIGLSASSAAKIALYREMRNRKITKAALGRLLKLHPPQVERLLDLNHSSRFEALEAALRALGKQVMVTLKPAA
jgi:antitoxin HicB